MQGTPTEVNGLSIVLENVYEGDYSVTYSHYGLQFVCNYLERGQISVFGINTAKAAPWKIKSSAKIVRAFFLKKIASFPDSWHEAHDKIYAD